MQSSQVQRILNNPTFQQMARQKAILSWIFSFLMLLVYISYIGFIGIKPEIFAQSVSSNSYTTWGIYAGLSVIFFAITITGIYVYKANGEFDRLTQEAIQETEAL